VTAANARRWRLFVLVLMLALTVTRLWQRGMFLDGVTYAVIARNFAIGVGTFWVPAFSDTIYREFFEQPPLGFALQGIAFILFGDHVAVERAYSVAIFLLHGVLIAAIWRRLLPAAADWLPVLIWLAPSVVTWAVVNNMLENTQAVFTSAACLLLMSTSTAAQGRSTLLSAAAALAVACAALVKGPVGLFPIAMPLLFPLLLRHHRPRHPAAVWITFVLALALIAAALAVYEPSRHAIAGFVDSHLSPVLAGERGIGRRSADIARHVTLGIALRMAIVAALFWMARRFRARLTTTREAAFFAALACVASVPIFVSPVLAGHYFVPSTPFFALAFAALALPALAAGAPSSGARPSRVPLGLAAAMGIAATTVVLTRGSLERRDVDLIRSLDALRGTAPAGSTLGACPSMADDWGLLGYLQRFYRISLDTTGASGRDWFLVADGACAAPPSCRPSVETSHFVLHRCGPATPDGRLAVGTGTPFPGANAPKPATLVQHPSPGSRR
jgi:hypothetical protein